MRRRKSDTIVRGVHLIGVILLEAAALAGILWLVAARADKNESPRDSALPTLRLSHVSAPGNHAHDIEQP